jgi:ribonuclease BN (tRNA processing enzyme)
VHDAQYSPEQKALYPSYGHSSWIDAAQVAVEANVKALALFHHDPDSTDAELQIALEQARAIFPSTFIACESMAITLPLVGELPRCL